MLGAILLVAGAWLLLITQLAHAQSSSCHTIASGGSVPTGYALPWNPLTAQKELLIRATCGTSATLALGNDQTNLFVYKLGYVWRNGNWQQYTVSGQSPSGDWFIGSGSATLPYTQSELASAQYAVAYMCQYANSTWKCGCRNATCSSPAWQLQMVQGAQTGGTGGTGTGSSDTQAPSVPQNVSASAGSASSITVTWSASTDNTGVTGYRVERCSGSSCTNWSQVGTPSGTSYADSGLSASTVYRYRVRATDAAGNLSGYSSIASATTQASTPSGGGSTSGRWQPALFTPWQWQLTGTIDQNVDAVMFDIDLFDVPASTIASLKSKGKRVVCYFSAGSYENWRSDANQFPSSVLGNGLDGWPGERWLDIRNITALAPIMGARFDLAKQKGCDGIEPDNIDAYTNNTGFPLTGAHQIAYNKWLAEQAHARGLSIALKNDVDQLSQLEPYFDYAVNEQCWQYNECGGYKVFTDKGKPVFNVEYNLSTSQFCSKANAAKMMSMKKKLNLDASREVCWGSSF